MSNFYGANATLRNNVPSEKIKAQDDRGRLRVLNDSYSFSAIIDTTDTLYMMKIPAGAKIYEVEVNSDDLGTTGDVNIGWGASEDGSEVADPDGFFAALDVNAAPVARTKMANTVAGFHKKFDAEVQVEIVPTEITTATSGTIELTIFYTLD